MNFSITLLFDFILAILLGLLKLVFSPFLWVWRKLSTFQHNVTVGVLIALFLTMTHHHPLLIEIENSGIDWLMTLFRGTSPPQYARHFVVLDIDEKTYRNWGTPLLTPRDKLLKLLQEAVAGQPRVIIVDIEFSQAGEPTQDRALHDYLANYCTPQTPVCPHIILARKLSQIISPQGEIISPYLTQTETFLDDVVAASPYLHWASTLFDTNPTYGNLRHWRLWEATCKAVKVAPTGEGLNTSKPSLQPDEVIPSMQLLSTVLFKDTPGVGDLRDKLSPFRPVDCTQPLAVDHSPAESYLIPLDGLTLTLTPSQLNRRVIYTIPWHLNTGEKWPLTKAENQPLLSRFSAGDVTEGPFDAGYLREVLKNSITVIGGSYADGRDLHATPLGWMPGYLVVINALHSLIQFGELQPTPSWVKYLFIELPLILLISWIFAQPRFNSLIAMLSVMGFIIFCLLPLSILAFNYGSWLNFIEPLLGVFCHQFFAYVEELHKLAHSSH